MAEIKTTANDASVDDFIASVEDPVRRADATALRELFERVTGFPAVMWGPAIIGFGSFHYQGRSSSGEWMIAGFSPRKAAQSLYGLRAAYEMGGFAESLGKHSSAKSCIYVKKLSDIDQAELERMIRLQLELGPVYEA
jgi:hypothetical protein